jgi:hypothetical protein
MHFHFLQKRYIEQHNSNELKRKEKKREKIIKHQGRPPGKRTYLICSDFLLSRRWEITRFPPLLQRENKIILISMRGLGKVRKRGGLLFSFSLIFVQDLALVIFRDKESTWIALSWRCIFFPAVRGVVWTTKCTKGVVMSISWLFSFEDLWDERFCGFGTHKQGHRNATPQSRAVCFQKIGGLRALIGISYELVAGVPIISLNWSSLGVYPVEWRTTSK